MSGNGTDELEYLAWETDGLEASERDEIIEAVVEELGSGVGVITSGEELAALTDARIGDSSVSEPIPGPQIGEVVDPELVLILLESTLIAIEASKFGKKLKERTAGRSLLARESFRSALESRDQTVREGTAESIDSVLEQHDENP